jgi:uncharacterized membrane protein YwzB
MKKKNEDLRKGNIYLKEFIPTTETFWNQMGAYNEATFQAQMAMIVLTIALTYLVFAKPSNRTNNFMKAFLSFIFAWNGIVFFLIYKNPISTFLGAPLFIIVAILFAVDIFMKKIEFRFPDLKRQRFITTLWVLLVFLYPLIGFALGHYYPRTILPVAPCSLIVFAIALVAAAIPKVDKKVYVSLLPWALMALPKCFGVLDCYEDCILFVAGVYGPILLVKNLKIIGRRQKKWVKDCHLRNGKIFSGVRS